MTIYFDKGNLQSFANSPSDDKFFDALRTIKNHLNIQFNFTKEEIFQLGKHSEPIAKFFSQLTQGRSNLSLNFADSQIPNRPIKSTFHKKLDPQRRSVLLIEEDVEALNSCKSIGACVIGGIGEEVAIINSFYLGNAEAGYNRSFVVGAQDPEVAFNSWNDLKPVTLPFYDLIISDRYLFKGGKKVVTANLTGLLNALHYGREVKSNIVLLTLKPDNANYWFNFDAINKIVADCTRNVHGESANFTLIWSDNRDDIVHDRNIFTNYQWITSGNSLNYFGSNNKVLANGSTLTVNSLVNRPYRKCVESLLEEVQAGILAINKKFPDYIQGNKKSNFLNFNS